MPTDKPGPELDARIAELMGRKPEKRCHENWGFPQFCSRSPECGSCEHWYADDPDPYSTDIAAAGDVVEWMCLQADDPIRQQFEELMTGRRFQPVEDVAPDICVAALAAVEETKGAERDG